MRTWLPDEMLPMAIGSEMVSSSTIDSSSSLSSDSSSDDSEYSLSDSDSDDVADQSLE